MYALLDFRLVPRWKTLLVMVVGWMAMAVSGVIVDGHRKDELSPMRNQTKDEESAIDAYNIKTCGMSDPNYHEKEFINMAREGQFPWIVSFQVKILGDLTYKKQIEEAKKSLNETTSKPSPWGSRKPAKREDLHFCSGSFISDRWILSAAHCFTDKTFKDYLGNDKLSVVAGSNKVSSRTSLNRNLTIERVYIHSEFDSGIPIGHDIALVELRADSKVNFTQKRDINDFGEQRAPFFNGVCLPLKDRDYKTDEPTSIAGWGLSQEKDVHTMPSKLLTTDLLLSSPEECLKHYKSLINSTRHQESHKFDDLLCASYKKTRDACQSDSGGPLMQYANKKAVVIGIVSYGKGCATKGVPGIYTRVSAYTNWIKAITSRGRKAMEPFKVLESKKSSVTGKVKEKPRKKFEKSHKTR